MIKYALNTAEAGTIRRHLEQCDPHFVQTLSASVNLADYAKKLAESATLCEAWESEKLAGLVAIYLNRKPLAFITNVSVLPELSGQGIATRLMEIAETEARNQAHVQIVLEVKKDNLAAIRLYHKLNFTIEEETADGYKMKKIITNDK